ncbi:hypothetical protein ACWKSP_25645 [Micromonosporaceae bacterium Da 78-11]
MLIAIGVVVQAAVIAAAWFTVLHESDSGAVFDKNSEGNWGHAAHSVVGTMIIPLLAVLLLVVSFFTLAAVASVAMRKARLAGATGPVGQPAVV